MIEIIPTKQEIEDSLSFAKKYDEGGFGKNVLGVSYEEYIDFIRIGKLCELAFVRYLNEKGIEINSKGILVPCKEEHKKGADFILVHSNQEVDIKAANKPFHIRILIREDQFKAHVHDLYIGAKYINDNRIEIWGYETGEYFKKIKTQDFGYGPCRHALLKDLKPIEKFISLCKNKEIVT